MALDESRELSAVRGGTPPEVTEARLWSLPGGRQSSCPSSSLCSAEPVSLQEEQSGVPGCALLRLLFPLGSCSQPAVV